MRAVAAEARKWEEQETRLVRQMGELTHGPTMTGGRKVYPPGEAQGEYP